MPIEPLENIKLSFKCPKQLNELQPCNGDWYCDGCHKIVYDFRDMSEAQVLAAFVKNDYKMCGLFEAGRIEVLPQNRWWRWASATMLFLGLTSCHEAVMGKIAAKPVDTSLVKRPVNPLLIGKVAVTQLTDTTKIEPLTGAVMPGANASFPGGTIAFYQYLYKSIKNTQHFEGSVIVSFTAEKDGTLSHFAIIKSAGKMLDAEIINALKNSPKWYPAIKNGGAATATKLIVPIDFSKLSR